jgi:D-alanyl-D-alanine carboxypeptidase
MRYFWRYLLPLTLVLALGFSLAVLQKGKTRRQAHLLPGVGPPPTLNNGTPSELAKRLGDVSIAVWDVREQRLAFQYKAFERRPIASLTKLPAAAVLLKRGIPTQGEFSILPQEYTIGGTLRLAPGERVSAQDLLGAAVVGSANNALRALVRVSGLKEEEVVREMNRWAIKLRLEQTHFSEVTGLDRKNISTAFEMARFAAEIFAELPRLAALSAKPTYLVRTVPTGREHNVQNPNPLLPAKAEKIFASKTGYLDEAGYCLMLGIRDEQGPRWVAVILGHPSKREYAQQLWEIVSRLPR